MTSYGASQLIIAQVLLKKIENPDFDAGGTLTHQAQAKNFFKFFEIHIIHREFQYEQNDVSVRRLRKIFPEKNVSKNQPGRATRCAISISIRGSAMFLGTCVTNRRTDGHTDRHTDGQTLL